MKKCRAVITCYGSIKVLYIFLIGRRKYKIEQGTSSPLTAMTRSVINS